MVKKCVFLLVLILLIILAFPPVSAQETPVCPTELSCPEIILSEGFTGEFVVNEIVLAAGNRATLQLPVGQEQVIIRNIQSGEQGFNQLFIYDSVIVNVNLRAGQTRSFNATPRKTFIRGTLNFTCRIANIKEGEDARCLVNADGIALGEVVQGQQGQFILDPTQHALLVQLIGTNADLWLPNTWESTVSITAGRTTNARSQFSKRAKLTLTIDVAGVVGDFYINDQLVAAQVPSFEQFLAAGSYPVAVKNIIDPAAAGAYRWLDTTGSVNLRAGQERTQEFRPRREFLPTPIPQPTAIPQSAAPVVPASSGFSCDCSKTCEAMSCDEAYFQLNTCSCGRRDGDSDGVPCENVCPGG